MHPPVGQRLARLHRGLPHVQAALGLYRRLDVVFLAHRHAAAGEDEIVSLGRAAQHLAGGVEAVGHDAEVRDLAA